MKIDLHIHTSTGSDGALSVEEVFRIAKERDIDLMSITDHDSVICQKQAIYPKDHAMEISMTDICAL